MFFPIGDTPNPPGFRAFVNWLLIAVNLGIYVMLTLPMSLTGADPRDPRLPAYLDAIAGRLPPGVSPAEVAASVDAWDLFVFEHGFKSGAPEVGDLFAAMFLHAGFAHVAGNLLMLWIYGDNVEHRLGRLGYLAAYLGTGLAATALFSGLSPGSMLPMVGASGAISGVLGAYFLMFPRNQVKVLVALFPLLFNVWLVPARVVLGLFVVLDNLLPLLGGSDTGVAYGAHLGGFFAGLGVAWVGERWGWAWPWTDSAKGLAQGQAAEGSVDGLRRALARGDVSRAIGEYAALPAGASSQLGARDRLQLAAALAQAGHVVAASRLVRAGLAQADGDDAARLNLYLGDLLAAQGELPSAYQAYVAALDGDARTAAAARSALTRLPLDPRLLRRLDR